MPSTETITLRLVAQDLASGNISKAIGKIDKMAQRGGIAGSIFQGMGIQLGMMLNPLNLATRGFGMLTDYLGDSVSAASDQEEALNRVIVVLGEAGDEAIDFAETTSDAFGLTEERALDAIGWFGNLFTEVGLAKDEAADFSVELTKLAADLGSFMNLDPSEALEKLQGGLVGQTRQLRELGIIFEDADVTRKMQEMGLAATQQNKVLARYNLILEQSSNAQGDFRRTSTQMANASRRVNASLADLNTIAGEALLPVMAGLADETADFLKGLKDIVDYVGGGDFDIDWVGDVLDVIGTSSTGGMNQLVDALGLIEFQEDMTAIAAEVDMSASDMVSSLSRLGMIDTESGLRDIVEAAQQFRDDPTLRETADGISDDFDDIEAEIRQGFIDISETVADARKYGITDVLSESVKGIELFDFKMASPKEWVKGINKELKSANVELKEFLDNPKARRSLQDGIDTMNARMERLFAKTAKVADLDTAGGNLMTVFGASILSKTNKAKDDVGAAMEELGLSGSDDFIAGFKPTPEQWVSTLPDSLTMRDAFHNLGLAARTGFLSGFGASINVSLTGQGTAELAEGGIVTRPTVALMGEAGPEAVIPLDGRHGLGSSTTVQINGGYFLGTPDEVAEELGPAISRWLRN